MSDYALKQHQDTANTIRSLAMDAVQKANSGHPGLPMGMADVATVLWSKYLKHDPQHPSWFNRDRFVLSGGHGSMLIYSLLYLSGYESVSLDEIKQFRQWGSTTPGHPEYAHTVGVETTTGPLGQGLSNAVGMAIAERWLAQRFNRPGYELVDHYTYVMAGDGDLMEGISHEVCSLAGHLGLGKLILYFDDNHISIDGPTDLAFTEDILKRFEAYDWHVQRIDGHDPLLVIEATEAAQAQTDRPSIIACRTKIGYGSPNKEGTAGAHGEPLGEDEILLTKERLGLPVDQKFYVADCAADFLQRSSSDHDEWLAIKANYGAEYPQEAAAFDDALANKLPEDWSAILPSFESGKGLATRASSGVVLNALAAHVPYLLGGSADLTGSNKTTLSGEHDLQAADFSGRYIRFGVREHGMAGIMNGMQLHGGVRAYGGTFLVFSDYMRPSLRLASMMGVPVLHVWTHDSIGLGEDGPTHQPIEHLMSLRLIPGMTVIRPAEANETAYAWQAALQNLDGPTGLVLSRQGVPTVAQCGSGALRGAYVVRDADDFQVILIGSGTELHIALEAQELLAAKGVAARVVSMPSWELFEAQSAAYKESVLPAGTKARVSIEAGATLGWERYVGEKGIAIGLDHFGASAPYKVLYEQFGLTAEKMVEAALSLIAA
ncbi:MAG: transketolase [Candidatus Promineifilaceae bacterium]|nr:transketolase [Candidatus Promineifilaceae bacterium]